MPVLSHVSHYCLAGYVTDCRLFGCINPCRSRFTVPKTFRAEGGSNGKRFKSSGNSSGTWCLQSTVLSEIKTVLRRWGPEALTVTGRFAQGTLHGLFWTSPTPRWPAIMSTRAAAPSIRMRGWRSIGDVGEGYLKRSFAKIERPLPVKSMHCNA